MKRKADLWWEREPAGCDMDRQPDLRIEQHFAHPGDDMICDITTSDPK